MTTSLGSPETDLAFVELMMMHSLNRPALANKRIISGQRRRNVKDAIEGDLPMSGTASDVGGIVSATSCRKTVRDSRIVTPVTNCTTTKKTLSVIGVATKTKTETKIHTETKTRTKTKAKAKIGRKRKFGTKTKIGTKINTET